MIEIYRNRDSAVVGHFQSLLEAEGIRTFLRNDHVSNTALALAEFTPALCVMDEVQVDRAVELIRGYLETPADEPEGELACSGCGEISPATLAACWNCGTGLEN